MSKCDVESLSQWRKPLLRYRVFGFCLCVSSVHHKHRPVFEFECEQNFLCRHRSPSTSSEQHSPLLSERHRDDDVVGENDFLIVRVPSHGVSLVEVAVDERTVQVLNIRTELGNRKSGFQHREKFGKRRREWLCRVRNRRVPVIPNRCARQIQRSARFKDIHSCDCDFAEQRKLRFLPYRLTELLNLGSGQERFGRIVNNLSSEWRIPQNPSVSVCLIFYLNSTTNKRMD